MGKFFANQVRDEAGIVGITLQKLLIFFMVLDALMMIFGVSFFASLLYLLFHFVVFMGVYRRRTAVLLIYVVVNVISFVLAAFALLFVASSMMYYQPDYDSNYDSSSSYSPEHIKNHTSHKNDFVTNILRATFWGPSNSTGSSSDYSSSSSSSDSINWEPSASYDYDSSSYEAFNSGMLLMSLLALVLSVGLLYCKILSVVLAHRMRRMLLAAACAPVLPVSQKAVNNSEQSTDATPFLVPEETPFFQPGFVPYPPMPFYPPQNGQAMMPPPFMYGQHPVFYTFAPMQQQPPAEDEKL